MEEFVQIDFKKKKTSFTKSLPFSLAILLFLLDQGTKLLIEKNIPLNSVGFSLFGDFFRIIHVTNKGIAFSLGSSFQDSARQILFAFLPLVVLGFVVFTYFKNNDFPPFNAGRLLASSEAALEIFLIAFSDQTASLTLSM